MEQQANEQLLHSYRTLTELRLTDLLERSKSPATLDDIQRLIFNESDQIPPSHYIEQLLSLIRTPEARINDDVIIPIIRDAWNYFPHRRLNGRAPAEILGGIDPIELPISHMPYMKNVEFDDSKVEDAALALLLLGLHDHTRVWKSHDWEILDRLFQKGYISDPARKARSVVLTDLGLSEAQRLFRKLFSH
jgi:hypothetical protein